jgi:hypothetical protein
VKDSRSPTRYEAVLEFGNSIDPGKTGTRLLVIYLRSRICVVGSGTEQWVRLRT